MRTTITNPARRRTMTRRIASVLALAPLATVAAPAIANACTLAPATISHPFAQYGDTADYTLIPGGTFQTAAAGWSYSRAATAPGPGPDTFAATTDALTTPADARALSIAPGGGATTPVLCVNKTMPTIRFLALGTGTLHITLLWRTHGRTHSRRIGTLRGTGTWTPTPALPLATAVPLTEQGASQAVRIAVTTTSTTWEVDDLYADPYVRNFAVIPWPFF
jgi:hypothetical protein